MAPDQHANQPKGALHFYQLITPRFCDQRKSTCVVFMFLDPYVSIKLPSFEGTCRACPKLGRVIALVYI